MVVRDEHEAEARRARRLGARPDSAGAILHGGEWEQVGAARRRLGERLPRAASASRLGRGSASSSVVMPSLPGGMATAPRLVAGTPRQTRSGWGGSPWPGLINDAAEIPRAIRARPGPAVWWGTMVAVSAAELVTAYADPRAGALAHLVILVALLAGAGLAPAQGLRPALLTLTLAPLIRIVSLASPLGALPQLSWFLLTAAPLLLAAALIVRECGWPRGAIGLRLSARRVWPLEGAVIVSGVALGVTEYLILRPAPLPIPPGVIGLVVAAVVLWVGTGVLEEVLFRGIMQHAASTVMSPMGAMVVVSALFAALHIGYKSPVDLVFVFLVALYFALVVRRTGSIWGVSIAHGLTNTFLFVVLPRATIDWGLLSAGAAALRHLIR